MFYKSEVDFAERFVSSLKILDVEKIPFRNQDFQNGVSNLSVFLKENLKKNVYDSISLLFLKRPFNNNYDRLSDILLDLSLNLEVYVPNNLTNELIITISSYNARILMLGIYEFKVEEDIMLEAARAFCKGAGIKI